MNFLLALLFAIIGMTNDANAADGVCNGSLATLNHYERTYDVDLTLYEDCSIGRAR